MAEEPFALSTISPPEEESDYDAICAAVMESTRGRWFLEEYARRNRSADTRMVLAAIEQLEHLIRGEHAAQAHPVLRAELLEMAKAIAQARGEAQCPGGARASGAAAEEHPRGHPGILDAAERLQDVAWTMRERGLDPATCQDIETLAASILGASAWQDPRDERVRKLNEVLLHLERRIASMLEAWSRSDSLSPEDAAPAELSSAEAAAVADGSGTAEAGQRKPCAPEDQSAWVPQPADDPRARDAPDVDAEVTGNAAAWEVPAEAAAGVIPSDAPPPDEASVAFSDAPAEAEQPERAIEIAANTEPPDASADLAAELEHAVSAAMELGETEPGGPPEIEPLLVGWKAAGDVAGPQLELDPIAVEPFGFDDPASDFHPVTLSSLETVPDSAETQSAVSDLVTGGEMCVENTAPELDLPAAIPVQLEPYESAEEGAADAGAPFKSAPAIPEGVEEVQQAQPDPSLFVGEEPGVTDDRASIPESSPPTATFPEGSAPGALHGVSSPITEGAEAAPSGTQPVPSDVSADTQVDAAGWIDPEGSAPVECIEDLQQAQHAPSLFTGDGWHFPDESSVSEYPPATLPHSVEGSTPGAPHAVAAGAPEDVERAASSAQAAHPDRPVEMQEDASRDLGDAFALRPVDSIEDAHEAQPDLAFATADAMGIAHDSASAPGLPPPSPPDEREATETGESARAQTEAPELAQSSRMPEGRIPAPGETADEPATRGISTKTGLAWGSPVTCSVSTYPLALGGGAAPSAYVVSAALGAVLMPSPQTADEDAECASPIVQGAPQQDSIPAAKTDTTVEATETAHAIPVAAADELSFEHSDAALGTTGAEPNSAVSTAVSQPGSDARPDHEGGQAHHQIRNAPAALLAPSPFEQPDAPESPSVSLPGEAEPERASESAVEISAVAAPHIEAPPDFPELRAAAVPTAGTTVEAVLGAPAEPLDARHDDMLSGAWEAAVLKPPEEAVASRFTRRPSREIDAPEQESSDPIEEIELDLFGPSPAESDAANAEKEIVSARAAPALASAPVRAEPTPETTPAEVPSPAASAAAPPLQVQSRVSLAPAGEAPARTASRPLVQPMPRPAAPDPLAALKALSEEERVALFT